MGDRLVGAGVLHDDTGGALLVVVSTDREPPRRPPPQEGSLSDMPPLVGHGARQTVGATYRFPLYFHCGMGVLGNRALWRTLVPLVVSAGAGADLAGGTLEATVGPTTEPPNDETRLQATVVDTLTEGESSWLLVDVTDGTVQGVARIVVGVEGSRVDCDGAEAPPYLLKRGDMVSFEVVGELTSRPQPPHLRWTASVAVVGGDVQMMCSTRAELAAVLDAERARWETAGPDDYEFTLHWEVFSDLFGDRRVSVVNGQPDAIVRISAPDPELQPLDLSPLPATIDDV